MKTKRPVLNLPLSKLEWMLEIATVSLVLIIFAMVAVYWSQLPESIVVHFDITGKPDSHGPKWVLLILAAVTMLNYAITTVVARFPHTFNYMRPITEENAEQQYLLARKFLNVVKLESTGIMFFAIWSCIQATLDGTQTFDVGNFITLMIILFVSIGIYMFRARSM